MRNILLVNAAGIEKTFLVEERHTFGRGIQCSFRVNHPQISRIQAIFEFQSGKVRLIDGDGKGRPSTNGSLVNGQRVQECWLKSGDKIKFGPEVTAEFHQMQMGRLPIDSEPILISEESTATELVILDPTY